MIGYYYKNGKLVKGEHPDAKATVIEAQKAGQMGPQQGNTLDFSSQDPAEDSAYISKLQQYNKPEESTIEPEQVPGGKASPEMGAAAGVQNTMASGGSPLDMAGSGMTSAGMMSANPYLVGAGLGVTALSSIQKGKNQREQNRYLAEMQKYQARQSSIEKMAQISQGLKA